MKFKQNENFEIQQIGSAIYFFQQKSNPFSYIFPHVSKCFPDLFVFASERMVTTNGDIHPSPSLAKHYPSPNNHSFSGISRG